MAVCFGGALVALVLVILFVVLFNGCHGVGPI
jgi:hypothetical protein